MEWIDELKSLIELHIATQDIPQQVFRRTVQGIESDGGMEPGSWVGEWCRLGDELRLRGDFASALQAYNFARFPFVDGPDRQAAHERCLEVFKRWVLPQAGIERRLVPCRGREVPVYTAGKPSAKRPLLVVMGGIVSIKEQWHTSLLLGGRLGFSVCVAEFPGVGENPLPYALSARELFPAIVSALCGDDPDIPVYLVAMSFSGNLALPFAAEDARVRGLVVSGTPLHHFFSNEAWWNQVPETTRATLRHLVPDGSGDTRASLQLLALSETDLKRVTVPVRAIVATGDEIIPPADAELLDDALPNVEVLRLDDVHGAPHYMPVIKKYIPLSLLQLSGRGKSPPAWVLRQAVRAQLLKCRLAHKRGQSTAADLTPSEHTT